MLIFGILLVSALEKLRSGKGFREVIRALGFKSATPLWLVLCSAELGTAALQILPVSRGLSSGAVAGLGLVFAYAGARAIRRGADVRCACYGDLAGTARLGRQQILALPVWLALAAVALLWAPATAQQRSTVALLAIVAVSTGYAIALRRATLKARADRTALVSDRSTRGLEISATTVDIAVTNIQRLGPVASKEPA
jgi:methylamine utilization protein MauE